MHGVDWNKVKERYSKMLAGAMTREEVDFIIGEMIGDSIRHIHIMAAAILKKQERKCGISWALTGRPMAIITK